MPDEYEPILPEAEAQAPVEAEAEADLEAEPRPRSKEPAPLPRLWKSPTEVEEVAETFVAKGKAKKSPPEVVTRAKSDKAKPKPKPKPKKIEASIDDGAPASKLEETPVLDTVEARQRARWLIGGLLGGIGLIAIFIIYKSVGRNELDDVHEGEPPGSQIVNEPRPTGEIEAQKALEIARLTDKSGKTQAALDLLNRLAKNYPATAAAREAMNAIDRHRRNRPLFGVDPPEQVSGPKPPAPNPPPAVAPPASKALVASADATPTQPKPPETAVVATNPVPPASTSAIVFRPLPRGFRVAPGSPVHASGWPNRIIAERDGAEMVLIPGGAFMMGRGDGEPVERPSHPVTLSTYYIDRHEVTVKQYLQFLKETGRSIDLLKRTAREPNILPPTAQHPVVNVSAREAKEYCLWADRKLPTEAQWEMAARFPSGRICLWDGEMPRKDPEKGGRTVEAVMSSPTDVTAFGAFDMGANAWEWTSDFYDSQYYQQFRANVLDPLGPKESRAKIALYSVRGSSRFGILTWREGLKSETRLPYLGFRGALAVEGEPVSPPNLVPPNGPNLPGQGGTVPF